MNSPTLKKQVSIIIPTFNRKCSLRKCLFSLTKQLPPDIEHEIIVVDDGSADDTAQMLVNLTNTIPHLVYLRQNHQGVASARNNGIKAAKYELLVFLDDDCEIEEGWLNALFEAREKYPYELAFQGSVHNRIEANYLEKAYKKLAGIYTELAIEGADAGSLKHIRLLGANYAVSRQLFFRYGFYDAGNPFTTEDMEFCYRLFDKGQKIAYLPQMRAIHHYRETFLGLARQHIFYGRGRYYIDSQLRKSQGLNVSSRYNQCSILRSILQEEYWLLILMLHFFTGFFNRVGYVLAASQAFLSAAKEPIMELR